MLLTLTTLNSVAIVSNMKTALLLVEERRDIAEGAQVRRIAEPGEQMDRILHLDPFEHQVRRVGHQPRDRVSPRVGAVGDEQARLAVDLTVGGQTLSTPFTVTLPVPGLIHTRATASLRLPVA